MAQAIEDLAAEFERRAVAAETRPAGEGFMLVAQRGYADQRKTEARVWREAAALLRERNM